MNLKQGKMLWEFAFAQMTWAAFVALKLTHALSISWWWSCVPLLGCLVSGIALNVEIRKSK